ncbi:MAG: TetR/AcrR family transcriptional regulator [Solirubrobacteraceae bacterium]
MSANPGRQVRGQSRRTERRGADRRQTEDRRSASGNGNGRHRSTAWVGEPLPRGRHKLGADVVRASQRERLIRAMLETVAERGYEATTVPEVVARARVSRNAFYEFFADKTSCFIAACDEEASELLGDVLAAGSLGSWTEALREGSRAYLTWWARRPAFSRAYFIGLPVAGLPAVAQRERGYARFREVFRELGRRAREEQPQLPPLDDVVPRVLVLAITELVAEEVRAGRTENLPALEDDIVLVATRLLAD